MKTTYTCSHTQKLIFETRLNSLNVYQDKGDKNYNKLNSLDVYQDKGDKHYNRLNSLDVYQYIREIKITTN